MIYTEFSKAFKFIDHWSILYVLDRLGVYEPLLSYGSYLNDRRQFVSLFS